MFFVLDRSPLKAGIFGALLKTNFLLVVAIGLFNGCAKSDSPSSNSNGGLLKTLSLDTDADGITGPKFVDLGDPDLTYQNFSDNKVIIKVPKGNRSVTWQTLASNVTASMPATSVPLFVRVNQNDQEGLQEALEKRFRDNLGKLIADNNLQKPLLEYSAKLNIDPALVVGAIVGEHCFNVGLWDKVQQYMVVSKRWSEKWAELRFRIEYKRINPSPAQSDKDVLLLKDFLVRPDVESQCGKEDLQPNRTQAQYWDCVAHAWNNRYADKTVGDMKFPAKFFREAFFNPIAAGMTYGIGQMDPVRALMVTDIVNQFLGLPVIKAFDPRFVYDAITIPSQTVAYLAANVALFIDTYRKNGFDISQNLGVIATLYNLGKERSRAESGRRNTLSALKVGGKIDLPKENYYGFWVNEKEEDIRYIVKNWKLPPVKQ